jgi:hypothetical protein
LLALHRNWHPSSAARLVDPSLHFHLMTVKEMGPADNGKGISVNFRYHFTEKMETFKFHRKSSCIKICKRLLWGIMELNS